MNTWTRAVVADIIDDRLDSGDTGLALYGVVEDLDAPAWLRVVANAAPGADLHAVRNEAAKALIRDLQDSLHD